MVTRRRMMLHNHDAMTWPVIVEAPMTLRTICLKGSITSKPDWRSSGYIQVPVGATKVRWKNYSTATSFRAGTPETDTQTTGIAMFNSGNPIGANTNNYSSKYSVVGANYVYISRQGTTTSAITIEFSKE